MKEAPEGYKRTEVGVIPEDWEVASLRSCLRATPDYGINAPAVPFDESLPTYLRITDIGEDHRYRPSPRVSVDYPNSDSFLLAEGEIVFARTGASVGKSYVYRPADGPLVFAGFLVRATPEPARLEPTYCSYIVQTERYWTWVTATSTRSGQPGINGQEYGTFCLPLPSNDEQHAIAEALSDVDGLLRSLEALIAKKKAIKQATMQQLLTGKTRLPGFSGGWTEKPLFNLAAITMGQSPPSMFYNLRGEGLPLIQGNADIQDRRTIERVWTTQSNRCCDSGDLLLTVRAPVGTVAVASKNSCLGRGVCGLKPIGDSAFLFYALLHAEDRWQVFEQGSTFTAANSEQIGQFQLRIPDDKNEQSAIAAILSDMDAGIASLEQRLDKTREIKHGMMQQLLTGLIRLVKPV